MTPNAIALAAAREVLTESLGEGAYERRQELHDKFSDAILVLVDNEVINREPGAPADENFDNISKWMGRVVANAYNRAECHAKLTGLLDKLDARIKAADRTERTTSTTDRWAWLIADFRHYPVRGADATVFTGDDAGGWDRAAARTQITGILAARTDSASTQALARWRGDEQCTSTWIGPIGIAMFPLPHGLASVDAEAQQACTALQVEYAQTVGAGDFIVADGLAMSDARERWAESIAATMQDE